MSEVSGRAAYEAYAQTSDGKSLVSGAPLPSWDEQRPELREAWDAAARAAVAAYIEANGRDPVDAAAVIAEAVVPELAGIREQLRAVYTERARLVAFLAACYPAAMLTDDAEPDWPIVFVSTPAGQLSWHVARADLGLFEHVPATAEPTWDGHTTEEKYERLAEMTGRLSRAGGIAGLVASAAYPTAVERDELRAERDLLRERVAVLVAETPPELRPAWATEADGAAPHPGPAADALRLERERDEARAACAQVRAILLEGGQDAATCRRRAIAAIERLGQ